jgi:hypothetical protein
MHPPRATQHHVALGLVLLTAPACTLHHRYESVRLGYAQRPRQDAFELQLGAYEVGPGGPRPQTVTAGASFRMLSDDQRGGIEGVLHLRLHAFRLHSDHDAWAYTREPFRADDPQLRRVHRRGRWATQRYLGRAHTERFSAGLGLDLIGGAYGPWFTHTHPHSHRAGPTHTHPHSHLDLGAFTPGVSVGAFARAVVGYGFTLQAEAGYQYADHAGGPFFRVGLGFALDRTITPGLPRIEP